MYCDSKAIMTDKDEVVSSNLTRPTIVIRVFQQSQMYDTSFSWNPLFSPSKI